MKLKVTKKEVKNLSSNFLKITLEFKKENDEINDFIKYIEEYIRK